MRLYPVGLVLEGRPCLVVGGGAVARRKVEGLVAAGARVRVVAPVVDETIRGLPGVTVEQRRFRPGDLAGHRLAISATGNPDVDRAVFEEGEAAGVLVNAADDPVHCSAVLPAVLRRGPLTVSVGTDGRSPALASWLRDRLAEEVGPEFEVLAELLAAERDAIRASGRSTEAVDWRRALDSDMLELIRAGRIEQAKERLEACL